MTFYRVLHQDKDGNWVVIYEGSDYVKVGEAEDNADGHWMSIAQPDAPEGES